MEKVLDGYEMYLLSDKSFYIEPPYLREHRERMKQLREQYEYNLTAEIPSWMSLETYLAIKKLDREEPKRFFGWIKKLFKR